MSQSKKGSMVEAITNVGVGYGIGLLSNIILLGAYGIVISLRTQIMLTTWFTIISIVRSYCLRRFFNWITGRSGGDATKESRAVRDKGFKRG